MYNESPAQPADVKGGVRPELDPSHTERAVADLEKSQAELAHVIGELGGRLAPVTAYTDSPGITEACTTDPSERSQLVRSIREAVDRTQANDAARAGDHRRAGHLMAPTTHTIDEALERFQLIGNSGGDADKGTASVMTALSWVAGEAWTDHPRCAHPVLANLAIRTGDHGDTTEAERIAVLRAGETGLMDTWWLPGEVVAWCVAEGIKASEAPVGRCMATLAAVTAWKDEKERVDLADANLTRAYLADANLADAYLAHANLAGANLAGANLTDAYLADAYLADANLTRAYLADANLADAYLAGAYLTDARCSKYTVPPAGWTVNTTTWRLEREVQA